MQSIERLRSFLGDSRTHTTRGSSSSSSVGSGAKGSAKTETLVGAAAAAAVPRGGGGETETADEDGGVGVGVSSGLADGELVKVARGRLDWLTRRLRDGLYSELATALSEADPLSSGGRVGGGGGGVGKAKGKGEGESKGGDVISAEDEERRREGVARIKVRRRRRRAGGGGGAYSFVACLCHLTIDHASLSRRSAVPTPNRDTSNIWALITLLPYFT